MKKRKKVFRNFETAFSSTEFLKRLNFIALKQHPFAVLIIEKNGYISILADLGTTVCLLQN